MITRRQLLLSSAAIAIAPRAAFASQPFKLTAEAVKRTLDEGFEPTSLWGFNGSTPGPTLRTTQGQTLDLQFQNQVDQASAVHWHGIRIDNAMDGVPGLTQSLVETGQSFDYQFVTQDAGTYWYHSHNRSLEQVARGLYGALIVQEETPPDVDHDIVVFIDDWLLNSDYSLVSEFSNMHDLAHGGQMGNFAKAVFQPETSDIKKNQRVRLRLINVATDRIFDINVDGIDGKIVAYDGMPLNTPASLQTLVIAPAQRVDIIGDVNADILISAPTRNGPYKLGQMSISGAIESKRDSEIGALPANPYQAPDLDKAIELTLNMEGGAMNPKMMRGGDIWAFNGVSGMQETPFKSFKRGQTAVINLVNDTMFAHAIHLHGHHFQPLSDGTLGSLRDTLLVEPGENQKIACVFGNPGKWLLHCHMLGHQKTGMKTWVEVA